MENRAGWVYSSSFIWQASAGHEGTALIIRSEARGEDRVRPRLGAAAGAGTCPRGESTNDESAAEAAAARARHGCLRGAAAGDAMLTVKSTSTSGKRLCRAWGRQERRAFVSRAIRWEDERVGRTRGTSIKSYRRGNAAPKQGGREWRWAGRPGMRQGEVAVKRLVGRSQY